MITFNLIPNLMINGKVSSFALTSAQGNNSFLTPFKWSKDMGCSISCRTLRPQGQRHMVIHKNEEFQQMKHILGSLLPTMAISKIKKNEHGQLSELSTKELHWETSFCMIGTIMIALSQYCMMIKVFFLISFQPILTHKISIFQHWLGSSWYIESKTQQTTSIPWFMQILPLSRYLFWIYAPPLH